MSIKTVFTKKAIIHARAHCIIHIPAAHFTPSSFLIAAIAATHGVYKSENTKNTIAVIGVNISNKNESFSKNKTERELTTLSFAIKPEISDADTRQSPKPRGLNTGAIIFPKRASMLSDDDFTVFNLISKF